jgi:tRNA A-37 threonylcarbamoyl transferase component Bud32
MESLPIIPLKDWSSTTLDSNTLIFFDPSYRDTNLIELATSLWNQTEKSFTAVRSHKWGGYVLKGEWADVNESIFFKHFKIHSPRHIHKPLRARHTFKFEERIRNSGFLTADPIALIEKKRFGLTTESALIFKEIPNAHHTYQYINDPSYGINQNLSLRRTLINALGKEVGRFHKDGYFHGDMHTGNIFTQKIGDSFRFFWIDNEEGSQFKSLPWRKRVDDLDHSNRLTYSIPPRDVLRFLESYSKETDMSSGEKRALWNAVEKKSTRFKQKRKN